MRVNAKKWITINCGGCGQPFEKQLKEYERQIRRCAQKEHFCNKKCLGLKQQRERVDEFSPFRFIYRNAKNASRIKKIENNLDLKFLKNLWEEQKGICPYTGIIMMLPISCGTKERIHNLAAASIDRIDSSKGYIKENIEFVCRFINLGKNGYSKQELLNFIKKWKRHE